MDLSPLNFCVLVVKTGLSVPLQKSQSCYGLGLSQNLEEWKW
jgi:hypothetical protein